MAEGGYSALKCLWSNDYFHLVDESARWETVEWCEPLWQSGLINIVSCNSVKGSSDNHGDLNDGYDFTGSISEDGKAEDLVAIGV